MKTLNGQPIDPEALKARAESMFDALERIANGGPDDSAEALREIARSELAPCHFFSFVVPNCGIANTEPEDMSSNAFDAWLETVPLEDRDDWRRRRWVRGEAYEYLASIRNYERHEYAKAFLYWKLGKTEMMPRVSKISEATAQTIATAFCSILEKAPAAPGAKKPQPPKPRPTQPLLMPLDPFTQPALI